MHTEETYTFKPDFLQQLMLQTATAIVKFLMLDLSTDFSRLVYNSQLVDYDELTALNDKLKQVKAGETLRFPFSKMLLLFTCAYIAVCFAQNKEAFFKWFLTFGNGEVDNSNNFREVTCGGQLMLAASLDEIITSNALLEERKQVLVQTFGLFESME